MSDLTTLEDQRLRRIREESLKAYDPKTGYTFSKRPSWNDINYLLSWINERQIGCSRSFNDWISREDFGIKSRNQLQRCWSAAAARMRDLCVGEITEMQAMIRKRNRDRDEANRPDAYRINILEQAVERLQSLTLDQVEGKQS